jgi:CHASE3 domain sensor protein
VRVNLVEYFERRQRETQELLSALESGQVRRLLMETESGSKDVTAEEKQRLRQTIADFGRAAENLRRISSSQI